MSGLRRAGLLGLASLLGLALACIVRPAGAWQPDGPVRLMVGTTPGGATDMFARLLAEAARGRLNQPVLVENVSGAGGNIAAGVARARPDGRTYLLGYGAIVINHVRGDPPGAVDPEHGLLPVAQLGTSPALIMVRAASGLTRFEQLVERLRADGPPVPWAPPVPGTVLQLVADQLLIRIGGRAERIPYRGGAVMLPDFLAGRLLFVSDNPSPHLQGLQDGSTRALAVLSATRSALLPEVPAIAELGFPGIEGTSWFGLFAPPQTPPDAVDVMAGLAVGAMSDPDIRTRLASLGLEPAPLGQTPFRASVAEAVMRWRRVVATMGER